MYLMKAPLLPVALRRLDRGGFPELVRLALQEVDDLVAHRAVLVGTRIGASEKQLLRTAAARFGFRGGEDGSPIRFDAVATDDVGGIASCKGTDRDGVFVGSVGRRDR
jgi:hypothetical protein